MEGFPKNIPNMPNMDTNMEDVGKVEHQISNVPLEPASIPILDGWIGNMLDCKQLSETDVQRLCDKVSS